MAGAKILIVDDDHDIRNLIAERLRSEGYETVYASDAMTAVTVARTERPEVIVLDLGLPGGTGLVVMERLKNFPALNAFNQNFDIAVGKLEALNDVDDCPDLVNFVGFGFVDAGIVLRGQKYFLV